MQIQLLGTAAAEGWPAPFCVCEACEAARARGGRSLRTRSGALVDDDLKIDFSPDTVMQLLRLGRSLRGLRTLVYTHAHSDHMTVSELEWACRPYTNTPPDRPIAVYGNEEVIAAHRAMYGDGSTHNLMFHVLQPLRPVTTAEGDVILPLPADHAPGALVLRITRAGGRTLFYGHDSGLYPAATLDALSSGTYLDIAVFDCTSGGAFGQNRWHMAADGVVQMVEELRRRGALTDRSRAIATHFSHNGKLLHEELIAHFDPHRIEVAYDGMIVQV